MLTSDIVFRVADVDIRKLIFLFFSCCECWHQVYGLCCGCGHPKPSSLAALV